MLRARSNISNQVTAFQRELKKYDNTTALRNVCNTVSSDIVGTNMGRVRDENRILGYTIGEEALQGSCALVDTWANADTLGANLITLQLDFVRVYESAQKATMFTLIRSITVKNMTLPDGTVIQ